MFGLTFLSPAFLGAAAAIAVPIMVHLFRRRTEDQIAFSAVRFLRRAPVEQARRRRLREMLLLALRIAAVLLLALAFSRPYFSDARSGAGLPLTVVAVDVSYSMSAPGQFARAIALAQQVIDGAPAGHQVSVVSFSDAAQVVAPPAAGRGEARAAIARLVPGFGATKYGAAVARAGELAGERGRIVLVTDLQRNGWEAGAHSVVPAGAAIEVIDAGVPSSNLAVIDLSRDLAGLTARIQNAGAASRDGVVRLSVDDRREADARFSVAAHAVTTVRFEAPRAAAGLAAVTVDDPDGYAADNARYLLLDPSAPVNVMAVTSAGNAADMFYLERALMSGQNVTPFRVVTEAAVSFEDVDPAALRQQALLWLLGTRNMTRRGRTAILDYIRSGGALVIAAGADVEPDVVADLLSDDLGVKLDRPSAGAATFSPVDARHPIFRAFGPTVSSLGVVRFTRVSGISDRGTGRQLAVFSSGQGALVEYPLGTGRILIFGSDLSNRWNDFPLQTSFVPFVHEITRYLTGSAAQPAGLLVSDLPPGIDHRPGAASLPDALSSGPGERTTRRVAVNVDVRESDPARLAPQDFLGGVKVLHRATTDPIRTRAREDEDRQRLWQYGLALMIVGLVAEGLLGSRLA